MTAGGWYLGGAAAVAGGFAVAYLVRTDAMARMVGIAAPTASARADYRAIYGGSQLGAAVFFALAAARPAWTEPGLRAAALYAGGFGLVRLGSLARDGARRDPQWIVGALEVLAAVGAALLAR